MFHLSNYVRMPGGPARAHLSASLVLVLAVILAAGFTQVQAQGATPAAPAPTPAPEHLRAFWKFESNLEDHSGNGNHGQAFPPGSEIYEVGKFGLGLMRSGDEVPVTLINATLTLQTQATLEAWVRSPRYGRGYRHIIDNFNGYALSIFEGRPAAFFRGPHNWWTPNDIPSLTPDRWHHVAATYDGSQEALYLDAELVATRPASGPITAGDEEVALGGRGDGAPLYLFQGKLDHMRVWDYAFTAEEVRQVYLAEQP